MAYQNQKKNYKKNVERIPNVVMDLPLRDEGKYDKIAAEEILNAVPWTQISLPVKAYKSLFFGEDKRGFAEIGFVKNYENGMFTVSISGRLADTVSQMENPEIQLRVIEDKETGKLIITNINLVD